jgi:hypothetical protein
MYPLDPPPDRVYGHNNLLDRVTVRRFGNTGIATSQLANEIRYTHVSHGGLVGGDDACIHADNTPTDCNHNNCSKAWHHNWVHDCREKCVRCDDGSESCLVDHNVIWNCGYPLHNGAPAGLLLKGWKHVVYANTIFNESNGQGTVHCTIHPMHCTNESNGQGTHTLHSYCTHTVLILYSYVLLLYSYCTHTLHCTHTYSYCLTDKVRTVLTVLCSLYTHTVLILYSYSTLILYSYVLILYSYCLTDKARWCPGPSLARTPTRSSST